MKKIIVGTMVFQAVFALYGIYQIVNGAGLMVAVGWFNFLVNAICLPINAMNYRRA